MEAVLLKLEGFSPHGILDKMPLVSCGQYHFAKYNGLNTVIVQFYILCIFTRHTWNSPLNLISAKRIQMTPNNSVNT